MSCWVAGDGPDTARLRAEFGGDDRIEWLGRITEAEKLARLRGASVFCAPSLHGESFGVVLIEAMAAGTPVVASALDGYRNVATDGVDALLVPPGDADALADARCDGCSTTRRSRPRSPPPATARRRVRDGALAGEYVAMYRAWLDDRPDADGISRDTATVTVDSRACGYVIILLIIVVVAAVIYLIAAYNGLIRTRNQIENAWSQIDVQLKRRLDLIPNLVETVKGYAAAREGNARRGHQGPQRGGRRTHARRPQAAAEKQLMAAPSASCSRSARRTPTSRPTRTSWPCRRS